MNKSGKITLAVILLFVSFIPVGFIMDYRKEKLEEIKQLKADVELYKKQPVLVMYGPEDHILQNITDELLAQRAAAYRHEIDRRIAAKQLEIWKLYGMGGGIGGYIESNTNYEATPMPKGKSLPGGSN